MKSEKKYLKILDWCIVKYGMSRYYDDYPDLDINIEDVYGYSGEFDSDNNLITIYDILIQMVDTTEIAIKTMIHEYQHYLQDPKLCDAYFRDMLDSENPFEIEAEQIAQRDWKECYNDVKIHR
jgi:hypothetical protein